MEKLQASTICLLQNLVFSFLVRPLQPGMPEENPYKILVPSKVTDWSILGR